MPRKNKPRRRDARGRFLPKPNPQQPDSSTPKKQPKPKNSKAVKIGRKAAKGRLRNEKGQFIPKSVQKSLEDGFKNIPADKKGSDYSLKQWLKEIGGDEFLSRINQNFVNDTFFFNYMNYIENYEGFQFYVGDKKMTERQFRKFLRDELSKGMTKEPGKLGEFSMSRNDFTQTIVFEGFQMRDSPGGKKKKKKKGGDKDFPSEADKFLNSKPKKKK